MASAKKRYHHGDLPTVLVSEVVAVLRERGFDGLTMREVARRAGVSHTAPYAHFADMQGLLAAVAVRGFELLVERLSAAIDADFDMEITRLEVICVEYVLFALEQPAFYRVMFGPHLTEPLEREELAAAVDAAEALVRAAIERCQSGGVLVSEDPHHIARTALSLLHGVASLHLEGRVPLPDDPDERVEAIRDRTRTFYFGLAPPFISAGFREMGEESYRLLGLRKSSRESDA